VPLVSLCVAQSSIDHPSSMLHRTLLFPHSLTTSTIANSYPLNLSNSPPLSHSYRVSLSAFQPKNPFSDLFLASFFHTWRLFPVILLLLDSFRLHAAIVCRELLAIRVFCLQRLPFHSLAYCHAHNCLQNFDPRFIPTQHIPLSQYARGRRKSGFFFANCYPSRENN